MCNVLLFEVPVGCSLFVIFSRPRLTQYSHSYGQKNGKCLILLHFVLQLSQILKLIYAVTVFLYVVFRVKGIVW